MKNHRITALGQVSLRIDPFQGPIGSQPRKASGFRRFQSSHGFGASRQPRIRGVPKQPRIRVPSSHGLGVPSGHGLVGKMKGVSKAAPDSVAGRFGSCLACRSRLLATGTSVLGGTLRSQATRSGRHRASPPGEDATASLGVGQAAGSFDGLSDCFWLLPCAVSGPDGGGHRGLLASLTGGAGHPFTRYHRAQSYYSQVTVYYYFRFVKCFFNFFSIRPIWFLVLSLEDVSQPRSAAGIDVLGPAKAAARQTRICSRLNPGVFPVYATDR